MRIISGILLLGIGLAGCQTTGGATTTSSRTYIAVAGKPTKLNYYMSVNPDCTPIASPVVRVTQAPQNGSTHVRAGVDFPHFVSANVRSACNRSRIASQQVWYTGNAAGQTDQVTVEVIYSSGFSRIQTFNIITR